VGRSEATLLILPSRALAELCIDLAEWLQDVFADESTASATARSTSPSAGRTKGRTGKRAWHREAVELKVWRDGQPDPFDEGLAQLDAYLDQHPGHRFARGPGPRIGLDTGVLVLFDRGPPIPSR
jgi:hypothetical protein